MQLSQGARVQGTIGLDRGLSRRGGAVWLMSAGGIVLLLAAGLGLTAVRGGIAPASGTRAEVDAPALPVEEIVVEMGYSPGESSGWHVHPIIHTVRIVSGTLTAYDDSCVPRVYGPGEIYAGGTERHLVRNEGDVLTEMIVSRVESPVASYSVKHLDAPTGCDVT